MAEYAEKAPTLHANAEGTRQGFLKQPKRIAKVWNWQARPSPFPQTQRKHCPSRAMLVYGIHLMASHWPPEDAPDEKGLSLGRPYPSLQVQLHARRRRSVRLRLTTGTLGASRVPIFTPTFERTCGASTKIPLSQSGDPPSVSPENRIPAWFRTGSRSSRRQRWKSRVDVFLPGSYGPASLTTY